MDERIAVVTGAGSGIGRAVSLAFQSSGYAVILVRRRAERLEADRSMCDSGGRQNVSNAMTTSLFQQM